MQTQSEERDRLRYEFDLKRDITEQFGPLLQGNLQLGAALNTLFVDSVRLHIAVSKQVEKVLFLERAGAVQLIEPDVCAAIARHLRADVFETELANVKNAMRHLYDPLSVANGNPLARLAVKKQLEINSRSVAGQSLFDLFAHLLPGEAVSAMAPVDHVSFAEHIRAKAFGPTPNLRLVECWYQASLYGLIKQSAWLSFTREATIEVRLDEAGEEDGVPTFSTVFETLSTRSKAIGEGVFFLGAMIALHTCEVKRPENLQDAPEKAVERTNVGLLALIDFYNAIPSREALKLAARHIYGEVASPNAPAVSKQAYVEMIEKMIERLPYEHDAPAMRVGKDLADISSVLPMVYSRIVVELDRIMRSGRDEFFDACVGPACYTPAQNVYIKVHSVATMRAIGAALNLHAQVAAHHKDFASYNEQELYPRAIESALSMLEDMPDLLAFYDPYTHQHLLQALQEMQGQAAVFLEAAAINGDAEPGDIETGMALLKKSARSIRRNERLSPESRNRYAQVLTAAVDRLKAASAAA